MKAMIKSNFKRRILPVFSSVVLLCLVVLVIIFTRTTEAAADSVTIGNRTYNEHNKMVILEIVPDERYDALGCLVADDQASLNGRVVMVMALLISSLLTIRLI